MALTLTLSNNSCNQTVVCDYLYVSLVIHQIHRQSESYITCYVKSSTVTGNEQNHNVQNNGNMVLKFAQQNCLCILYRAQTWNTLHPKMD
jgi:hypothetical protein